MARISARRKARNHRARMKRKSKWSQKWPAQCARMQLREAMRVWHHFEVFFTGKQPW